VNGTGVVSQAHIGDMLLMLIVNHVLRRSDAKSVTAISRIWRLFHPVFTLLLHVMSLLLVLSWSMLDLALGTIVARWLMVELMLDKDSV